MVNLLNAATTISRCLEIGYFFRGIRYLCSSNILKLHFVDSVLNGYDEFQWKQEFRMAKQIFYVLVHWLKSYFQKQRLSIIQCLH